MKSFMTRNTLALARKLARRNGASELTTGGEGFLHSGFRRAIDQRTNMSISCGGFPSQASSLFHSGTILNFAEESSKNTDASASNEAEGEEAKEEEEEPKEVTVEDKLVQANERIAELEMDLVDQKDKVLRTFAEMENVRMITKRDVENAREYSIQSFAKGLLDVADNLERALESVGEENVDESPMLKSMVEGVGMTDKELKKIFKKHGVSQFGEIGDKFDPNVHDALFQYEDPNLDPGVIGQVIKKGFMFKSRTLRPAQVGCIQAPKE